MKVTVCCRIRPNNNNNTYTNTNDNDNNTTNGLNISTFDPNTITIGQYLNNDINNNNNNNNNKTIDKNAVHFQLDHAFDDSTEQVKIFQTVVEPLLEDSFKGINCTLFSYGQTGSGKTHTLQGNNNGNDRGIIPRTIEYIFNNCNNSDIIYDIRLSVMEIYQEKLIDLLRTKDNKDKTILRIREQASAYGMQGQGVYVDGLIEKNITKENEFNDILQSSLKRRTVGSHNVNIHSSRSHLIVIITTKQFNEKLSKRIKNLAGSEMVRKTDASGQRLEEAKHINKSLSALGKVIFALTALPSSSSSSSSLQQISEKQPHIPYRDSKLTRLLQDSLGGNSRTVLILTVSSAREHLMESLATLRFGERAKQLRTKPQINAEVDDLSLKKALIKANQQIMSLNATIIEMQSQIAAMSNHTSNVNVMNSTICEVCNGFLTENNLETTQSKEKSITNQGSIFPAIAKPAKKDKSNSLYEKIAAVNKSLISPTKVQVPIEVNDDDEEDQTDGDDDDIVDQRSSRCAVCGLDEEETNNLRITTNETMGPMFTCDGNCGYKYHARCVGMIGEGGQYTLPEGEWYCTQCTCEAVTLESENNKEGEGLKDITIESKVIETINDNKDNIYDDNNDNNYNHPDNQIIAGLKADFHMMRRERNRILFQWQNEKKIASVLETQRLEADRVRDMENIRILEENRIMKDQVEQQKEEITRMKKFTETYLNSLSSSSSSLSLSNLDVKSNKRKNDSKSNSNGNGNEKASSLYDDDNDITISNNNINCHSNSNSNSNNDKKKFSDKSSSDIAIGKANTNTNTNKTKADNENRELDVINNNNDQIKSNNLASSLSSSLGLITESSMSIPKPWMKKSIKATSNRLSNTTNMFSDQDLKPLSTVSLSKSLPFPESREANDNTNTDTNYVISTDNDNDSISMASDPNSRYLYPLKNRLEELLRSVKAETTSFGEIRSNHKKRVDNRDTNREQLTHRL